MTSPLFYSVIVILGITAFLSPFNSNSSFLGIQGVQAAPWPVHVKHATHRTKLYGRGLKLEGYHPKSTFKTYNPQVNSGSSSSGGASSFVDGEVTNQNWRLNESAIAFASSELGINASAVDYRKGWTGTHGSFAYLRQFIEGIPVANAVANIAYNNASEIVSFGSSFVDTKGMTIAPSTPTKTWKEVLPNTEAALGGKYFAVSGSNTTVDDNDISPNLEYVLKSDGTMALAYVMQIRNEEDDHMWVEAFVDAHSGELVHLTDFVAHATFNVVPIQKQNFFDGREVLVDPEDLEASPNGWVAPSGQELGGLASGNNAIIFTNGSITINNQRVTPQPNNANGTFDNSYDPNSPFNLKGVDATIDNAFYVMNTMHDFAFKYGFQEKQGNFQEDNFGKGGATTIASGSDGGGDPVQVSIFDTSGRNNAVFSTPPDGISPTARFFFFQINGVTRDSAFANDVMVHEFTHGITGRMTGGGSARCLQTLESGGMGEGWSDMMAVWVGQTSEDVKDFKIGTYFTDAGIRSKPYSTDGKVNPLKFSDVAKLKEVHANALTQPDGIEGNVVFMHNMIDALLLQPCNPTMLQARDAILQADVVRFNGANQCTMWKAFARKGMGVDAGEQFTDGFAVPPECAQ
ncbi:Extracellular metalloproteinase NpI [Leucoagaricus sp. SymC.cos]|nr:Extracellular metalloproteinase NpI [Leucoagaricus sp. SymC.cos]